MIERQRALTPDKEIIDTILRRADLYDQYVNGLMLIHDHVTEFSDAHGLPRYNDELRRELINEMLAETEKLHRPIHENLNDNLGVANEIQHEAERSTGLHGVRDMSAVADAFLDDVVSIYARLRNLKRNLD